MTQKSKRKALENFPAFLFDPTLDSKRRSIMMEKEMNEQLKIINDLRTLGASNNTVAHEERRLQELQALCYKYFRRDMIKVTAIYNLFLFNLIMFLYFLYFRSGNGPPCDDPR